jgi:hypothetical protein
MDDRHFDAFARILSAGYPRRHLTRVLAGLSVASVVSAFSVREAVAALRNGGVACTQGSQCKTDTCLGSGKCSCSRRFPTCKPPTNPCKRATCNVETKRCVTRNQTDGALCTIAGFTGTCLDGVCTDCGQLDDSCCPNGICGAGGICAGSPFKCLACGDDGQPCCVNDFCAEGECNFGRRCGQCGGLGQACCLGSTCDVELTCRSNFVCENA